MEKVYRFAAALCLAPIACVTAGSVDANTPTSVIPFPTPRVVALDAVAETRPSAVRQSPLSHVALPRPRPFAINAAPPRQAGNIVSAPSQQLRSFFSEIESRDAVGALRIRNAMPASRDRQIASFMIATSGLKDFRYETLASTARDVAGWPGQSAMTLRQEQAILREKRITPDRLAFLAKADATEDGRLFLIEGLVKTGKRQEASNTLRKFWVEGQLSSQAQSRILNEFAGLLSNADHKRRLTVLLYKEDATRAAPLVRFLPADEQALANARLAVIRRSRDAEQKLQAVPERLQSDAGYFYAVVQHLRRQDKWLKAAEVLKAAPRDPKAIVDGDAWWIERRLVSRKVREAGHHELAYELVRHHAAERDVRVIDAEFHAGWYALRFLKSPKRAFAHFQKVNEIATRPLSQSRGLYWTARTYEENGQRADAKVFYQRAAKYAYTYYGQLALQKLGSPSIALSQLPDTNKAVRSFNNQPMVQVLQRLHQIGQGGRTGIFYRHLARTLKDPLELVLLAQLAEEHELYTESLQVGKIALGRGFDVPRLAFPLGAITNATSISRTDRALAYAISRQESAFDISAVSRADARGLMQLLPATAKATANKLGIAYKPEKLTRDGAYNARLGSKFLNDQIARFGGSYILAFAAYNAGPRRANEWVARFGDPRKNSVDAVDWVEKIPFSETRNYVQRVMENFQIYRFRLEGAPLTITQDLNRGTPS